MFCQTCGKENQAQANFCAGCGVNIETVATERRESESQRVSAKEMTFGRSISTCMSKYVDFSGRAARPEYWWFSLFAVLLTWFADMADPTRAGSTIISLVLLLPSFSACSRRLHDTGRSGWWQLLSLTIIGIIPLIIWCASKGESRANEYGNPVQ